MPKFVRTQNHMRFLKIMYLRIVGGKILFAFISAINDNPGQPAWFIKQQLRLQGYSDVQCWRVYKFAVRHKLIKAAS